MKKLKALAWLGFFFLLSCASTHVPKDLPPGISALFSGEHEAAQSLFEERCLEGVENDCFLSGAKWSSPAGLPILQSFSNANEVTLQTVNLNSENLRYYFRPLGPFALTSLQVEAIRPVKPSLARVDRLSVQVQPGVTYELMVLSSEGEILDRRRFSGLQLAAEGLRFALISCLDDAFQKEQRLMWQRVLKEEPDVIWMIGDNTYATRIAGEHVSQVSPEILWTRYVETLATLDVYRWESLVPIWATWDDHDYGMNDGNSSYKYTKEAQRIFHALFTAAEPVSGYDKGPGVSYQVALKELDLYFLDNRSFRRESAEHPHGHLGQTQRDWLLSSLKKSARPGLLISGDQFFGGYHPFESYEGSHPAAFKTFLGELKQLSSPVAFLSGDRHHVELMEVPKEHLGYKSFELTSSALHARTYPDSFKRFPSPHQVHGAAGVLNFALIKGLQASPRKLGFHVTAISEGSKPLFEYNVNIERE